MGFSVQVFSSGRFQFGVGVSVFGEGGSVQGGEVQFREERFSSGEGGSVQEGEGFSSGEVLVQGMF